MEFNEINIIEEYLNLEKEARENIVNSLPVVNSDLTNELKVVTLHPAVTEHLVKVYKKKKTYNNITITSLKQFKPNKFKTLWGVTDRYETKFILDKDVIEGFFEVRYEFKNERITRNELFYIIATGSVGYKESSILATEDVRKEFLTFIKKAIKKSRKRSISSGVWTIETVDEKHHYVKKPLKEINTNPLITPARDVLENDLNFFFNNIEVFSCFGQTPNRKVLLAGPQGTGKSSMAYAVARKYEKELPVVFTNNIAHAGFHLRSSAKKHRKTILILEDADATFQETSYSSHSGILNLLDGIDMPHNKAGFYMIMTTNYPEKIEDRIKKRPGRVDKIITVNTLKGNYALKCATEYMKALMDGINKPIDDLIHEQYLPIFEGLSGAQIKDVITATRIYMTQNQIEHISFKLFEEVKTQIKESLKSLDEIEKDLSPNLQTVSKFGFNGKSW